MPKDDGLDELDSRIIYQLGLHARQPLSKIAKRLHTSVQRLDYRIRVLEKKGVIVGYPTLIDSRKLGPYRYFVCCIRTYKMSSREQDGLLQAIAKDDKCTLAFGCEGAWDAIIGTVAKDIFEAKATFSRLLVPFEERLRQKIVYTDMRIYNYGQRRMFERGDERRTARGGASSDERKHQYIMTGEPTEASPRSELDLDILRILSADARTPSVKIAKLAGTTPETAAQHIRKMEHERVIEGYTTLLDPNKYGHLFIRINVQLTSLDEARLGEITEYVKRFPNMFRLIELFESDGFMIDMVCRTYDEMERILSEFRDRYREQILDIDIARISRIYKATYFPTFAKTAENGKKRPGRPNRTRA